MAAEEEEHDENYYLEQAIKLSLEEDALAAAAAKELANAPA